MATKKYLLLFLCIMLWIALLGIYFFFSGADAGYSFSGVIITDQSGNSLETGVEEYVSLLLSASMPEDWSIQAMMAQAVVFRTQIYRSLESGTVHGENRFCTGCKSCFPCVSEPSDAAVRAAESTRGTVLCYDGRLIDAYFHPSSCAFTASAEEVLGTYIPYLTSVDTPDESGFPAFVNSVRISAGELGEKIKASTEGEIFISYYNSGRVKNLYFGETAVPGEEMVETLSLKSQCFEAVRDGSDIVFTSYGYGSGLGLSQYGAYLEAQSGKNFKEILVHYFSSVKICDINSTGE